MTTIKTTDSGIKEITSGIVEITDENKIKLNPPQYPELEGFSKPQPQFESDLQRHYRFEYFFGLDNVSFKSRNINMTCGKITKEIEIGKVDHIELEAAYSISEYSSVEFSIIDQDEEIPIMPINDKMVRNERIFFGLPLRFSIDRSKPYYIKKDGVNIDTSPEAAMNANDGLYTITYTPLNAQQYKPREEKVQLKIILRQYEKTAESPFVKSALIRAYGGDALWIDRL